MKKTILTMIVTAACCLTAQAAKPSRPMLEQGKTWCYIYHHYEDREEPGPDGKFYDHWMWMSYYQLKGDTVIDGRAYMKMYRTDDRDYKQKYYGAFREDDEGRVYMYDYRGDKQDFLLVDFTLQGYQEPGLDLSAYTVVEDNFMESGRSFHRYKYLSGGTPTGLCAVEGVGFSGKGLVHYVFEPEPNCVCDYEELASVGNRDFWFTANGFLAPKNIELTDDERQLVASNNDFAFRLFRKVRGKTSSVISPLSITFALGMLNNAAAGQTQQEINQTLGFGEAGAGAINAFSRKMLDDANTLDAKTKAIIANTIFINEGQGYYLQEPFVETCNDYYDAQPQSRDFFDGETMDVINQWASDHTEQMIRNILNEQTFNPAAVSYLLDAIYFKGQWSSPFDAADTYEEPFGGGPTVPVMAKLFDDLEYADNDLYQAINLPYGNGAYKMTVFLPREGKTVGDVLDALSGSSWQTKGRKITVDVKLPRFESEKDVNLKQVMAELGMPTAFTDEAEFPYFCNRPIYIGMMRQKARIRVDEQGTEAAAVTIIGAETTGMPEMARFYATRPFVYVISEQSTGAIFFIGQYTGGVTVGGTDSIDTPSTQRQPTTDDVVYSLSGQRLSGVPAKGFYIRNGRKLVVTQ